MLVVFPIKSRAFLTPQTITIIKCVHKLYHHQLIAYIFVLMVKYLFIVSEFGLIEKVGLAVCVCLFCGRKKNSGSFAKYQVIHNETNSVCVRVYRLWHLPPICGFNRTRFHTILRRQWWNTHLKISILCICSFYREMPNSEFANNQNIL